MRLIPSDPDVETIVSRIESGDIDLQPEFQRGEVWSRLKKQRLIDSILRDWHVPPVHVIENPKTRKHEVLDGQQRLAAIRDFVSDRFPVDGATEPIDPAIESLDGKFYSDLPDDWRRRFNQFTIRLFRIVDYRSAEPAEIFFRLNQPASLTGAEQRNAFFGPVRQQIKSLVDVLEKGGLDKDFIGFSNLRMAYDDVLSRTALAIQRNSLDEKITASDLANLYRSDEPLSDRAIDLLRHATSALSDSKRHVRRSPRFNKATLFSWLMLLVRAQVCELTSLSPEEFAAFLDFFEEARAGIVREVQFSNRYIAGNIPFALVLAIYESRSSARVADVSSVILRDAILWLALEEFARSRVALQHLGRVRIERIHAALGTGNRLIVDDDNLAKRLISSGWGRLE